MNTFELSLISFISMYSLTLTILWLLKKYPGIICKLTRKHKNNSLTTVIYQHGNVTRYEKCSRCNHVKELIKKETDKKTNEPQGNGGVRVTFYFSAPDVEPFPYVGQVPEEKTATKFERLKSMIDIVPDNRLQVHVDTAIYQENYELATYIRDVARKRGVKLDVKKQQ